MALVRGRWRRSWLVPLLLALVTLGLMGPVAAPAHAAGCFSGARKFIYTESNGNQHHIVEFDVNLSAENSRWYIAQRPAGFPFSANPWPGYYNRTHKWVGYQWPLNWQDPYAPSSWTLCYR